MMNEEEKKVDTEKKYYILYCENCSYKRITDGSDVGDLYEYKRNKIPTGIPKIDPITKKTTTSNPKVLPKMFRCPKCGRLVRPKKVIPSVIPELKKEENDEQNISQRSEGSSERSSIPQIPSS